ncbi:MAG: flippase [Solobacterium sp.]|nr:flippase [Solobacterium sp.]
MNSKVIKNASWMIGARVLQMLLGLIISAWTSRYLGPSNFGAISYVGAFVSFFTAIATLGLNNVIIKELIDHKERDNVVLGTSVIMRLVSSIFFSLCVIGLISILNPGDRMMIIVAVLLSLTLVFQSFEMITYWYQSRLESKVTSIIQTVAYLSVAGCRLIGLIQGRDVLWFAFANSVDTMVMAILLYISYKIRYRKPMAWDTGLAKEMLSKSHHFIYSALMIAVYSQMDSIMIKEFMNTGATGHYGIAIGFNSMWAFVLEAIIASIYPTIIEAFKSGNKELYHGRIIKLYSIVIWFSTAVSIGVMLCAKYLVLILYGADYLPSVACLRLTTWINTFAYLGVARGAWMVCEDNQKYQKYILGIGAAINLVLNYVLIPKYGILGAASATLITQITTSTLAPLIFRRTRENTMFIMKGANPAVVYGVIRQIVSGR